MTLNHDYVQALADCTEAQVREAMLEASKA